MKICTFAHITANILNYKLLKALNSLVTTLIRFPIFGVTINLVQSIVKSIGIQTLHSMKHQKKKEVDIN